ncbi:U3 small nucleolar RNA-associated protein 20 [Porphyridium purpureum]|uniref:U3 small nucleolar RNA-associated protein 20 n=1 Tax=Porphyridium purpureum TaxID=35688 RepID=A0A5J4Z6W3_PORPP|nr:U3 small nucleolar RNA-associated protein 20 [Porphyridium purpureum]|eukprot:POR4489..scf295_1
MAGVRKKALVPDGRERGDDGRAAPRLRFEPLKTRLANARVRSGAAALPQPPGEQADTSWSFLSECVQSQSLMELHPAFADLVGQLKPLCISLQTVYFHSKQILQLLLDEMRALEQRIAKAGVHSDQVAREAGMFSPLCELIVALQRDVGQELLAQSFPQIVFALCALIGCNGKSQPHFWDPDLVLKPCFLCWARLVKMMFKRLHAEDETVRATATKELRNHEQDPFYVFFLTSAELIQRAHPRIRSMWAESVGALIIRKVSSRRDAVRQFLSWMTSSVSPRLIEYDNEDENEESRTRRGLDGAVLDQAHDTAQSTVAEAVRGPSGSELVHSCFKAVILAIFELQLTSDPIALLTGALVKLKSGSSSIAPGAQNQLFEFLLNHASPASGKATRAAFFVMRVMRKISLEKHRQTTERSRFRLELEHAESLFRIALDIVKQEGQNGTELTKQEEEATLSVVVQEAVLVIVMILQDFWNNLENSLVLESLASLRDICERRDHAELPIRLIRLLSFLPCAGFDAYEELFVQLCCDQLENSSDHAEIGSVKSARRAKGKGKATGSSHTIVLPNAPRMSLFEVLDSILQYVKKCADLETNPTDRTNIFSVSSVSYDASPWLSLLENGVCKCLKQHLDHGSSDGRTLAKCLSLLQIVQFTETSNVVALLEQLVHGSVSIDESPELYSCALQALVTQKQGEADSISKYLEPLLSSLRSNVCCAALLQAANVVFSDTYLASKARRSFLIKTLACPALSSETPQVVLLGCKLLSRVESHWISAHRDQRRAEPAASADCVFTLCLELWTCKMETVLEMDRARFILQRLTMLCKQRNFSPWVESFSNDSSDLPGSDQEETGPEDIYRALACFTLRVLRSKFSILWPLAGALYAVLVDVSSHDAQLSQMLKKCVSDSWQQIEHSRFHGGPVDSGEEDGNDAGTAQKSEHIMFHPLNLETGLSGKMLALDDKEDDDPSGENEVELSAGPRNDLTWRNCSDATTFLTQVGKALNKELLDFAKRNIEFVWSDLILKACQMGVRSAASRAETSAIAETDKSNILLPPQRLMLRGKGADVLLAELFGLGQQLGGLRSIAFNGRLEAVARQALLEGLSIPNDKVQLAALKCLFRSRSRSLEQDKESLLRLADDDTFREELTLLIARKSEEQARAELDDLWMHTVIRLLFGKMQGGGSKHGGGSGSGHEQKARRMLCFTFFGSCLPESGLHTLIELILEPLVRPDCGTTNALPNYRVQLGILNALEGVIGRLGMQLSLHHWQHCVEIVGQVLISALTSESSTSKLIKEVRSQAARRLVEAVELRPIGIEHLVKPVLYSMRAPFDVIQISGAAAPALLCVISAVASSPNLAMRRLFFCDTGDMMGLLVKALYLYTGDEEQQFSDALMDPVLRILDALAQDHALRVQEHNQENADLLHAMTHFVHSRVRIFCKQAVHSHSKRAFVQASPTLLHVLRIWNHEFAFLAAQFSLEPFQHLCEIVRFYCTGGDDDAVNSRHALGGWKGESNTKVRALVVQSLLACSLMLKGRKVATCTEDRKGELSEDACSALVSLYDVLVPLFAFKAVSEDFELRNGIMEVLMMVSQLDEPNAATKKASLVITEALYKCVFESDGASVELFSELSHCLQEFRQRQQRMPELLQQEKETSVTPVFVEDQSLNQIPVQGTVLAGLIGPWLSLASLKVVAQTALRCVLDGDLASRGSAARFLEHYADCLAATSSGSARSLNELIVMLRGALISRVGSPTACGEIARILRFCVLESVPGLSRAADLLRPLTRVDEPEADFFLNVAHIQVHRRARALRRVPVCLAAMDPSAESESRAAAQRSLVHVFLLPFAHSYAASYARVLRQGQGQVQTAGAEDVFSACMDMVQNIVQYLSWTQFRRVFVMALRMCESQRRAAEETSHLNHAHDHRSVFVYNQLLVAVANGFKRESETANEDEVGGKETESESGSTDKVDEFLANRCIPTLVSKIFAQSKSQRTADHFQPAFAAAAARLCTQITEHQRDLVVPVLAAQLMNGLHSGDIRTCEAAKQAVLRVCLQLGSRYFGFVMDQIFEQIPREGFRRYRSLECHAYILKGVVAAAADKQKDGGEHSQLLVDGAVDSCLKCVIGHLETLDDDAFDEAFARKSAKESALKKMSDVIECLARQIDFAESVAGLLRPLAELAERVASTKERRRLMELMRRLVVGIAANKSVCENDAIRFVHTLLLKYTPAALRGEEHENGSVVQNKYGNEFLVVLFALQLLNAFLAKEVIKSHDSSKAQNQQKTGSYDNAETPAATGEASLTLLDPFLELVLPALKSRHDELTLEALRVSSRLLKAPRVRGKDKLADAFAESLILILSQTSVASGQTAGSGDLLTLHVACLRFGGVLFTDTSGAVQNSRVKALLAIVHEILSGSGGSFSREAVQAAMALFKGIVSRVIMLPLVYDIADMLLKRSVSSQNVAMRVSANDILLQFLLHYPLSEGKVRYHFAFIVKQLEFAYAEGRMSALTLLDGMIRNFPAALLDQEGEYLFLPLASALTSDEDEIVRTTSGNVLVRLAVKVSDRVFEVMQQMTRTWWGGRSENLKLVAASVTRYLAGDAVHSKRPLGRKTQRVLLSLALAALKVQKKDRSVSWPLLQAALDAVHAICETENSGLTWYDDTELVDLWAYLAEARDAHLWPSKAQSVRCRLLHAHLATFVRSSGVLPSCDYLRDARYLSAHPGCIRELLKSLCNLVELLEGREEESYAESVVEALGLIAVLVTADPSVGRPAGLANENGQSRTDETWDVDDAGDFENESGISCVNVALRWLINRLAGIACRVGTAKESAFMRRAVAMRCLLTVCTWLDASVLAPFHSVLARAVYYCTHEHDAAEREVMGNGGTVVTGEASSTAPPAAQTAMVHVARMMQEWMQDSVPDFFGLYAAEQRRAEAHRRERKRRRAVEAAAHPELAARRKRSKLQHKKEKRRAASETRRAVHGGVKFSKASFNPLENE